MYSFEGEFRRRPNQSFGGSSKKEKREDLLQRAMNERQKREDIRKRFNSAIKIQAFVRGSLCRAKEKRRERDEFDVLKEKVQREAVFGANEHVLLTLLHKLLFFYHENCDSQRLIWLCQLVLKYNHQVMGFVADKRDVWIFKIVKLQRLCFSSLVNAANSQQPIAVPLRILEMFFDEKTYLRCFGSNESKEVFRKAVFYMVQFGCFRHLRTLIDTLVPKSIELSGTASTPVADSLLNLLLKPLRLVEESADPEFQRKVLCEFAAAFLCPEFSNQVLEFVLPALARKESRFPFSNLVNSLLAYSPEDSTLSKGSDVRLQVSPSPWLLYSILTLASNRNDCLIERDIWSYLQLLKLLMPTLNLRGIAANDDGSTLDSDDDMVMEETTSNQTNHSSDDRNTILDSVTDMINDPPHVQLLLTALDQTRSCGSHLMALCHLCHSLLNHHKLAIYKYRLLHTLAFKPEFLRYLWHSIASMATPSIFGSPTPLLQMLSRGLPLSHNERYMLVPVLALFCSLMSYLLQTLHDSEFYGDNEDEELTTVPSTGSSAMPCSLAELASIGLTLRDVCLGLIELAYPNSRPNVTDDYAQAMMSISKQDSVADAMISEEQQSKMWTHLFKVAVNLVRQLHSRDTRRSFCPKDHWLVKHVSIPIPRSSDWQLRLRAMRNRRFRFGSIRNLIPEHSEEEGPPLSTTSIRNITILRELPFVVPFYDRVLILQQLILKDKAEAQEEANNFLAGQLIQILVRRNYLYEDAFDKLSPENEPNLRLKMRVQLVNFIGLDEAGIDGGGIFREFINELLLAAFNPNRGFFVLTLDNLLYPNPSVHLLHEDFPRHYYFIGRILGKAIYENMLVELPFASFFLSKLLGRHTANVDIDHLNSLDPVLYRNLLSLKKYDGDVSDLGLDFTVVNEELGETKVEELEPGGSKIAVTEANKIRYIHLMADYKLNRQIHAQCAAFKQGLFNVLDPEWLQMFDWKELQVLISGAHVPINIDDLRQHTNYAGVFTVDHPMIQIFWKVVSSFTDCQKRQLLKFVTSCSRPPLLGFKDLYPAFCIQSAGTEDRLPTASTCMNLLKLPEFKDESTMRIKLLYAIESASGFELS